MTIQIDDAGWGCLLGGVIIGVYREETQRFVYGEVPVRFFQPPLFGQKAYLDKATEVVSGLLVDQMVVQPGEPVQICSGYVFTNVYRWLAEAGLSWSKVKVEGPLQVLVETTLQQRLAALGVEVSYEILTEKQGLLFWKCLRWLKGGYINARRVLPGREVQAKTGWSTYSIWAGNPYQRAKQLAKEFKAQKRRQRRPW